MILLILILIMSCMMIFTSCGDSKVTDIAVTGSNQPRLTYVQGQELDLSKGSITVLVSGKETQVPLDAEGVTVSGYDKNTLGKQTLTITYLDKTTTYDVNVIARITAESYEKNYFVGDSINLAKGKLKIAKDNGTVSTVNFNNPNISVKSFDSSTAGEKKVTISYTEDRKSVV